MNDYNRARLTRWLNTSSLPLPESVRTWLLERFVGHRLTRVQLPDSGLQLMLDLSDAMESNLFLDRAWEPEVANWAAFFAARSTVLVDVGAHIGYYTVLLSRYGRPGCTLHAFEPDPRAFERLSQNAALNAMPATLNQAAVAARDGTAQFTLPRHLRLGTGRFGGLQYANSAISVDTTSLDAYCDRRGLSRVDLVKMDIEGGEADALQGMQAGLQAGRYGALLIEFHQTLLAPEQAHASLEQLRRAGYRLFEIHADRLIAAETITTACFYAFSPAIYQALGSPQREFLLPAEINLPFPECVARS